MMILIFPSAELLSLVLLIILVFYLRSVPTPSGLLNRFYWMCLFTASMTCGIHLIARFALLNPSVPAAMHWVTMTLYMFVAPQIASAYYVYSIAYLTGYGIDRAWFWGIRMLPVAAYMVVLASNYWTHLIFYIDPQQGLMHGPLQLLPYLVAALYLIMLIISIMRIRNEQMHSSRMVFLMFPIFSVALLLVQLIDRRYLLSGSAGALATIIIFLNIQSDMLYLDGLTNLPSRSAFIRHLEQSLHADSKSPLRFALLTLRDLRQINSRYGHAFGNRILQSLARDLRRLVPRGSVYRYGGDRFAFVLNEPNAVNSDRLLTEILQRIKQPRRIDDRTISVDAWIGAVDYPDVAFDQQMVVRGLECSAQLVRKGDTRSILRCDLDMLAAKTRREQIRQILEDSLLKHAFILHYQLVWSIAEQRFSKAEALVRLPESPLGPISPGVFIPIAEESDLIIPLSHEIIQMAIVFLKQVQDQNLPLNGVSVNLPYAVFQQADFAQRIQVMLDDMALPRDLLQVEITERTMLAEPALMHERLNALQAQGIRIILDDFGTGYSNVMTFMQMPFETIKIDRSLVTAAMEQVPSEEFLRKIVEAFRSLSISVVAEGVETKEQADMMASIGCTDIQGYFYAKPQPGEQIIEKLLSSQPER